MGEAQRWNRQGDNLCAERDGLRLVLHLHTVGGYVRFVVIDHRGPNHDRDRVVGSGSLEDVRTAKKAAEKMAARLSTTGHD